MTFARFCSKAVFIALLLSPGLVLAAEQQTIQMQYETLLKELRCLTCPNETIAESSSPMAQDVKLYAAQHLEMKETPDQIKKALVARYGEAVLYKPGFTSHTLVLWLAPIICLLTGLVCVVMFLRRKRKKS